MWTIALTHVDWPWRLFLNSTASPHALKGSRLILSKAEVRSFRKMKKKMDLTRKVLKGQRHLYLSAASLNFSCLRHLSVILTVWMWTQFRFHLQCLHRRQSSCCVWKNALLQTAHSKYIISPLLQVISLLYLQMGICRIRRQHDWAPHKGILEVKTVVACRDVTKYCIRCTV